MVKGSTFTATMQELEGSMSTNALLKRAGMDTLLVCQKQCCYKYWCRFKFIYYCSDGIDLLVKDSRPQPGDRFPFSLVPLELELDEIHDLAAELDEAQPEFVLCFNRPLSKPSPAVPTRMLLAFKQANSDYAICCYSYSALQFSYWPHLEKPVCS